jgi:hypothetical protein
VPLSKLSPKNDEPAVLFAWYKHLWATNERQVAFAGMQSLSQASRGSAPDIAWVPLPCPAGPSALEVSVLSEVNSGDLAASSSPP